MGEIHVRDQSCVWGPAMYGLLQCTSTRQGRKLYCLTGGNLTLEKETMYWSLSGNLTCERGTMHNGALVSMEVLSRAVVASFHTLVRCEMTSEKFHSWGGAMRCGSGVEGWEGQDAHCVHLGDTLNVHCLPAPPAWAPCSISFSRPAALQESTD